MWAFDFSVSWIFGASYLFGSLSTGLILTKLHNLKDPRTTFSKNPGATNMMRTSGAKFGIYTLIGDMIKAMIPIMVAKHLGMNVEGQALAGFMAFIGHIFPIYHGFKGGKGVATSLGMWLGLYWPAACFALLVWSVFFSTWGYVSLASIVASFATAAYIHLMVPSIGPIMWIVACIVLLCHLGNIQRIINGEEKPLAAGKKAAAAKKAAAPKKPAAKKAAVKKPAAKKASTTVKKAATPKKPAAKTTSTAKKATTTKKPAAKKATTAKKPAAKKSTTTAKKPATKKASTATKKSAAKKPNTTTKKAPPKKPKA